LKEGLEVVLINTILEKSPIFCSAKIALLEANEQPLIRKIERHKIFIIIVLFTIYFFSGFFLLV
jgi:hypothetical protein